LTSEISKKEEEICWLKKVLRVSYLQVLRVSAIWKN
jgi:hypothetical protein